MAETRADCPELIAAGTAAGAGQQPGIPQAPGILQQQHDLAFAASPTTGSACTSAMQNTARSGQTRRFILGQHAFFAESRNE